MPDNERKYNTAGTNGANRNANWRKHCQVVRQDIESPATGFSCFFCLFAFLCCLGFEGSDVPTLLYCFEGLKRKMRLQSKIQSAIVYIKNIESNGNWVPLKIEANSWITLQPGKIGGHAEDSRRHGGSLIASAYKAKVLQFKVGPTSTLKKILVEHAYMFRQLQLDLAVLVPEAHCNCKKPLLSCNFNFFRMLQCLGDGSY